MTPENLAEHPVPTTWSGHRTYTSRALVRPESLDSLRALIRTGQQVRALGSRHSFNDLADSPGCCSISLRWCPSPSCTSPTAVRPPSSR